MAESPGRFGRRKLPPGTASDDRLDMKYQKRNALIYASLISLTFFAAPVLYIGIQAGLCKHLHDQDEAELT